MQGLLTTVTIVSFAMCVCAQPIFDYVAAPDASFRWLVSAEPTANGLRVQMVSQVWQGIEWSHRVAVVRPSNCTHPELCVLLITGGDPGDEAFSLGSVMAQSTGTTIAVLGDIPNQPLFDDLSEDALISFTFSKYLETRDPTWPALYPMTKAAVRAMDMLQALSEQRWGQRIEGFVVAGGSKRGWTTWFTGEVDPRVRGIIPIVYDNLNIPAQMREHLAQWGRYSEQIEDYTQRGLPDLISSEEGAELAGMVDPYTYRDRATMPKLIVNGTNDRYWPLGAANLYFDDLPGPKYLLYAPNCGHGIQDLGRVLRTAGAFVASCAGEFAMPQLQWRIQPKPGGANFSLTSDVAPLKVLAWTAESPTKDFRDARWTSEETLAADGAYLFELLTPAQGYAAAFLEPHFEIHGREFSLSTQMRMVGPGL